MIILPGQNHTGEGPVLPQLSQIAKLAVDAMSKISCIRFVDSEHDWAGTEYVIAYREQIHLIAQELSRKGFGAIRARFDNHDRIVEIYDVAHSVVIAHLSVHGEGCIPEKLILRHLDHSGMTPLLLDLLMKHIKLPISLDS